jgi:protease-4
MFETETVLDRRRLRRHLSFWRLAAIAALAIAAGAYFANGDSLAGLTGKKQIARITLEGTISEDRKKLKMLSKIAEADHVAALIVFVNSPGGTTTGGEALYEALREVSKKKPVVAQFGTVAASAGYIVGLATDHIVARGNTITGSVGVIVQWPEVSDLLDKVGVKVNEVKSGLLKATPSLFQPLDEPGRKVTTEMVADSYKWFVSLVEQRRGIKADSVPGLMEGRIFSGRQALAHKLVDEIGGEAEAVRWLEDERKIDKKLKVVDWKPSEGSRFGLTSVAADISRAATSAALTAFSERAGETALLRGFSLDGLVSVWHPSEN